MRLDSARQLRGTAVVAIVFAASVPAASWGQSYPSRPIRMIVASAPGGGSDFIARILGDKLAPLLGQPVVVDNRAGAGGNIAAELAARAAPDGHTLIVAASSHTSNITLYRKLGYHPIKDFTAITQLAANAFLLCVNPSSPAKSAKELVALAQSKKGAFSYASAGVGQGAHLGMELLKSLAGFEATHVPYPGIGPAAVSLMAGQVDVALLTPPSSLPQIRAGRLRALGVTLLKRTPLMPDIPTLAETGYPGYEVNNWTGLLAPAGTPRAVVARLHEDIARSMHLPDVVERLATVGTEPVASRPDDFAAFLESEIVKWSKVIRQSGARAD